MKRNIFTEHPKSINETYLQHLLFAAWFGIQMIFGGLAAIIHAIFPFVFEKTASNILISLTRQFVNRMPVMDEKVIELGRLIDSKKTSPT